MFLKKHFKGVRTVSFLAALFLPFLFNSCFNSLSKPKSATVSFYLDTNTLNQILSESASSRSAAGTTDDSEEYYIEVSLIGDETQTKEELIKDPVQIDFENVAVGSKVYATAQIFEYLDSEKTSRRIIYRGQSASHYVRENSNTLTITLKTAKLQIVFESNGGSEVKTQTVLTGTPAQEPENPVKPAGKASYSRENYAFAGWFSDEELTKPYNFELPVYNDITLYAKWIPDFVLVKGETVQNCLAEGRSVKISDLFVSDHEVSQAEYLAVAGINPSVNKSEAAEELPVENVSWFDAIIYCNKLSLKEGLNPCYKVNGKTDPKEWGELTDTTAVSCNLTENGYRLPTESEWDYIAQKGKRTNVDFGKLAYYGSNGESKTHKIKYKLANELCVCDLLGNVSEWCFDWYGTVANKTSPTGPITGTDRVVKGGSYNTNGDINSLTNLREYAAPTSKESFIGFRVVRTVVYDFKIIKNTVTFEPNGGSDVEIQIIVNGNTATEPAEPTRTGYTFKGWKYNDEAFDFSTPVTQDILLEAQWEAISYKVIFDSNFPEGSTGGTGSAADYNATYDQFIELPASDAITAPNGYHFKVWSLAANSETLTYDTSNPKIKNLVSEDNGTITLYAIWDENEKHYIHYQNVDYTGVDVTGLKSYFKESVDVNNTEILSPSGTRTGYTFSGWYYSDETENVTTTQFAGWSAGQKTTDIYLYAQWTPITYKVRFKGDSSNPSGSMADQEFTYDADPVALSDIGYTRTGYTFAGWTRVLDSTDIVYTNKQAVRNLADTQDAIVNLYTVWTPTTYKVIYNLDGGTITGTQYDATIGYYDEFNIESPDFTLPTTITKDGAVFDGWYTSSTNFSETNKITKIVQGSYNDKAVYAKWNYQRTISVTIVSGDWSSTGGGGTEFTVTFGGSELSEGDTVTGTSITLTATSLTGYTYSWEIDGSTINPATSEEYSTTNILEITDVSGWYWPAGVYDVVVSATNGTAYESFYLQIKVN